MTGHRDWASIKAALNGIRFHDDENYLAARSRDVAATQTSVDDSPTPGR